jgi:hypothetical protein
MQIIVMASDNYYDKCLTPFMYLWHQFFTAYTPADLKGKFDLLFCGFSEPDADLQQFAPWRFHSIGAFKDYPVNKWSDAMLQVLDTVADEVFLLLLEDFWLCRPADVRGLAYLFGYARQFENVLKIDTAFDRLYIHAGSNFLFGMNSYSYVGHLDLLKSPHGTPYQFSLWGGIWRRDVMRRFIVPGETAQQLELGGSARVTDDVLVLGTRQAPLLHGNIYRSGRGGEPAYGENGWRVPDAEVEFMRGRGWIE